MVDLISQQRKESCYSSFTLPQLRNACKRFERQWQSRYGDVSKVLAGLQKTDASASSISSSQAPEARLVERPDRLCQVELLGGKALEVLRTVLLPPARWNLLSSLSMIAAKESCETRTCIYMLMQR